MTVRGVAAFFRSQ